MQEERKARAGNRVAPKGSSFGKKQRAVYLAVIFILLFVNIVLLCKMQVQMKHIQDRKSVV